MQKDRKKWLFSLVVIVIILIVIIVTTKNVDTNQNTKQIISELNSNQKYQNLTINSSTEQPYPIMPLQQQNSNETQKPKPQNQPTQPLPAPKEDHSIPPLKLKGIGFDLGYYDKKTNMAGEMKFTKEPTFNNRIWSDFGEQDIRSPNDSSKRNVQPIYLLPLGTKARAIVDGVVLDIPKLYSNDYSIHIGTSKESPWRYEIEHVINPVVKVGDTVKAGQIIAEVSTHGSQNSHGLGLLEIGILKGGNPPQHICPFAYLDPSVKDEIENKIIALRKAWEEYKNNKSIYDEENLESAGCVIKGLVEG